MITQELLDYIKNAKAQNLPDKEIAQELVKAGWMAADIQEAMTQSQKQFLNVAKKSSSIRTIIIIIFILAALITTAIISYLIYFGHFSISAPTSSPENSPISNPTIQPATSSAQISQGLSQAHSGFGFELLSKLAAEDLNRNIIISPTSVALALSMTYNGASASTEMAMAKTLHLENMDLQKINTESKNLLQNLLNPDDQVEIAIANSIWSKKGIDFAPDFINFNKQNYNAEVAQLDFSSPEAADIINNWVSKNTREKIPTIVPKLIDPTIVMYLINAIYFNGAWTYEFDPKLTTDKAFTQADNVKIQHPLMQQKREDFLYLENDQFQAVTLTYGKNQRLKMYVFLPKKDMSNFITQINLNNWNLWTKSFQKTEGTILLPKFKIEYEKSLVNSLISLGMGDAFDSVKADFSKIRPQKDVFITDVRHKTFIDVGEKGTEAAAVTSVEVGITAVMPEKKTFYMEINKPFFFAIFDSQTTEILFLGIINSPKK